MQQISQQISDPHSRPHQLLQIHPSRFMLAKSPSAFATHSAVSGFIERFSVLENLPNERIADGEPLTNLFRRADKQVDWKGRPDSHPNCDRLIHWIFVGRHDHEEVDVGIWGCPSVGVRPKENHAISMKIVPDAAADISDRFDGNHLFSVACTSGAINVASITRPGVIRTHDQGIMSPLL
jgi:hypothetical protein